MEVWIEAEKGLDRASFFLSPFSQSRRILNHRPYCQMSEKRRAELELKRAKLAELRKAKADREAERRAIEVRPS